MTHQNDIYRQLNKRLEPVVRAGMKASDKYPDFSEFLPDIHYPSTECILPHTLSNSEYACSILEMNRGTLRKHWLARQRSIQASL